jgi:hypothetical protein
VYLPRTLHRYQQQHAVRTGEHRQSAHPRGFCQ